MSLKLITRNNFYSNLFEYNSCPDYIKAINLLGDDLTQSVNKTNSTSSLIHSICFTPSYLDIEFPDKFKYKKIYQMDGFGVNLSNYNNVDEYIKSQGSKNFRKVFFRCLNRLEASFNISYKMYYGSIDKNNYDILMNALENMISKRFQNRNTVNKDLDRWQQHYDQTFNLINQNKASLFVIYDNQTPIEVSLNYHVGSLMYSSISSFDLDYSKFSLGNIEIYKQLEWCLLNNIKFFDMGYGDFDYKRRWSNQTYRFNNFVISKKQKATVFVFAAILEWKYQIVNFLVKAKVKNHVYDLINSFKKSKEEKEEGDLPDYPFELNPLEEAPNCSKEIIDINTASNQYIRQPLYNYLYSSNTHINNITIYKIDNSPHSYLIKDNNKLTELILKTAENV